MLIIDVLLKQIREKVLPAIVYTEKRALPRLIKEFLKHVLLQGGSITLIILVRRMCYQLSDAICLPNCNWYYSTTQSESTIVSSAQLASWVGKKKTTNKRRQGMPESLLSKFLRCKLCNCKQMAQQDTNALTASSILEVRNARSSSHGENPLTWLPSTSLRTLPSSLREQDQTTSN